MFEPDTPANRALFLAIKRRSVEGVRSALKNGADIQARHGRWGAATCTPLMKAIDSQNVDLDVVAALLEGGAPLYTIAHAPGRLPAVHAIRSAQVHVCRAMVASAGGLENWVEGMAASTNRTQFLSALSAGAHHADFLAEAFFRLLNALPRFSWPQSHASMSNVHWPWGEWSHRQRLNPGLIARLGAQIPCPKPESVGREQWIFWMRSLSDNLRLGTFQQGLLRQTPRDWWLENLPMVDPFSALTAESMSKTVPLPGLFVLVDKRNAPALKIALQSIGPAPKFFLDHGERFLQLAARRATAPVLRLLQEVLPEEVLKTRATQRFLFTLSQNDEGFHRDALARTLFGPDVDVTETLGETGQSALELVLEWPAQYRDGWVKTLLAAGASWNQSASDGGTVLSKAKRLDPLAGSAWHAQLLNEALPEASVRPKPRF